MPNLVIKQEASTFLYIGPSMMQTFHPGDELQLIKQDLPTLQRGDVVVFEQSKAPETITVVHRIVAKKNSQWLTRGDNNLHLDPEPLNAETLVGLVISRRCHGRTRPVLNGIAGWLYAQTLFVLKYSWSLVKRLLQPLYALLRTTHLRHPIWQPTFSVLILQTEEHGTLIKTLYHGHTVARYWVRTNAWHCQKPFDLVIQKPNRNKTNSTSSSTLVKEPLS